MLSGILLDYIHKLMHNEIELKLYIHLYKSTDELNKDAIHYRSRSDMVCAFCSWIFCSI